jgi:exonuclease SbcC
VKILELRFRNLNSLTGEWHIDFTHPDYENGGIFAITGPTGSGKTTILDAICLALYGQTPRLGKVTAGTNEIMSRHTAECFAEVIFESSKGRFKCHWSQNKARKQPDGKLQSPQHEISDADTGAMLESKIRDVLGKVHECTGLEFSQFTRSILLAQGGFAAFLSASPSDRSPILEQITGTEIYTEISRRVHVRASSERSALADLQDGIERIRICSEDELRVMARETEELEARSCALQDSIRQKGDALSLVKRCRELGRELETLKREEQELSEKKEKNRPGLALLGRARAARRFDPDCQTLQDLVKDERRLGDEIEFGLKSYEALREECRGLTDSSKKIEDELAERETDSTLPEKIGGIRILAKGVLERSTTIARLEDELARVEVLLREAREKRTTLDGERAGREEDLQDAKDARGSLEDQRSAVLKGRTLHDWREQESGAQSSIAELGLLLDAIRRREENRSRIAALESGCIDLRAETETLSRERAALQDRTGGLEKTIAALEENCRLFDRIRDLEDERRRLEDGSPCPLCGSTDHPYSRGTVPEKNEAEQELAQNRIELSTLRDRVVDLGTTIARAEAEHSEKTRRLQDLAKENETLEPVVSAGLSRLSPVPEGADLSQEIESRIGTERERVQESGRVIAATGEIDEKLRENTSLLEKIQGDLDRIRSELENPSIIVKVREATEKSLIQSLERERKIHLEERSVLNRSVSGYGVSCDIDRDLEEVLENLSIRSRKYRQLSDERGKIAPKITSVWDRMEQQKERVLEITDKREALEGEITTRKGELLNRVADAGFMDWQEFLEARIDRDRFEFLEQLESELKDEETRISTLVRSRTAERERLIREAGPGMSVEVLEKEQIELQDAFATIQGRLAEIHVIQEQHRDSLRQRAEQKDLYDLQKVEADRWSTLDRLIGSHDGKAFRTFAQGITFEHLIRKANRHLRRLNKRYILVRTEDGQLDMDVVDLYQAGERRSTKNLSGGETFIVSLALALGLSDMASHNVRVDSLFLDEGFGTLDAEALELALEALMNLQTEGKLIGIISHVPALKERIPVQVVVEKKASGTSTIIAPGCTYKA